MEAEALFVRDGDAYVGTILTQGGWDPRTANGGTVLALLGHCLEDVPTLVPMVLSRFTADLHRPVPLGRPLHIEPAVVREGKKLQVVELRLAVDGVEHARASALRLRTAVIDGGAVPADTTADGTADRLAPLEEAWSLGELTAELPGFLRGVDMRRARLVDGTGTGCWVRLGVPVVAGEPIRRTARLTVGFDYANLIGMADHPTAVTLINPDVSAHVLREPVDEWIAITGHTVFNADLGRGLSYAQLSDRHGVFAVVSITQLIQPR